jgi:hypothetical protein
MLKRAFIAFALATGAVSVLAQTTSLHSATVAGNSQTTNTCTLVKRNTDLKARLVNLGWVEHGANYPGIDWRSGKIAAVITTSDQYAVFKQGGAAFFLPSEKQVVVSMVLDSSHGPHAQIFVLELDSNLAIANTCRVEYPAEISAIPVASPGIIHTVTTTTSTISRTKSATTKTKKAAVKTDADH